MRLSKIFAMVFGVLGMALTVLTLVLSFGSLDGAVYMPEIPEEANTCTEKLMEALCLGDYPTAESYLYGDSGLGQTRDPATAEGIVVWKALMNSLSYSFEGPCYAASSGICRDVTVTALDVSSITPNLSQRVQDLLDQRIQDAQGERNMNLVYDDEGKVLEAVADAILQTAVSQALSQDSRTVTVSITLKLILEDGTWQVVPDPELLKAVSGGL